MKKEEIEKAAKTYASGKSSSDVFRDAHEVDFIFGAQFGLSELTDITHRNYLATVRRGLITPETTSRDFILKVKEECQELHESYIDKCWEKGLKFDPPELADIALVCFAMAEHYGIDLVDEMRKKMEFNEQRKD